MDCRHQAPNNLWELLARPASDHPERPALLAPGRRPLTYRRLLEVAAQAIGQIRSTGIGPGDRVALVLPDGPEMAAAFVAVGAAAACAPLNPSYKAAEFEYYLQDLEARAIILFAGSASPARAAARTLGIRVLELRAAGSGEAGAFELLAGTHAPGDSAAGTRREEVALLLHTSGTTSRPKLVPLTQGNLSASAGHIRATLQLEPADLCLNIMPLFHIHGLIGAVLSSLAAGAGIVCTPGFRSASILDWLEEFRPTWFTAVPTMLQSILVRAGSPSNKGRWPQLRLIRSSSASLPPAVMVRLEEAFGVPVIESYGMTEASHQMASNPLPPGERKPGSVGRAAGPQIAVMAEEGRIVTDGRVGEVVIRGPNVTAGYLRNPMANAEAFRSGWFRTGDLGYLDGAGYLFLTGRVKEQINRGGEKISPREIEERLLEHPAVIQAVAFAISDARLGEDVAAAVVLAPGSRVGEAELREFTFQRLSDFKVPRRIVFLDEIPKGPTGKLQRIGLAERLGIRGETALAPEARAVEPRGATERRLAAIFARLLERPGVGVRDNFFLLGGDSILAAELLVEIEREFGLPLSILDLLAGPTVECLAVALDGKPAASDAPAIVAIQPSGSRPPLFCAQTIEGDLIPFANLARYLGDQQPLLGLPQPDLTGRADLLSIEEVASIHLRAIRVARASGPYCLMGLCFGGQVVYEIARRLEAQGERVALLVLVDCINHNWERDRSSGLFAARGLKSTWCRMGYAAARMRRQDLRGNLHYLAGKFALFRLAWRLRIRRALLEARRRRGRPVTRLIEDVQLHNYVTSREYEPGPYGGRIILVRAEVPREEEPDDPLMGWGSLASGGVIVTVIPGDHYSLMSEPNIRVLAEVLGRRLAEAQRA